MVWDSTVLLMQGGPTAMYTLDHHGDEGQLGLLVRQWSHHGPVVRPPHPSFLHAAGTAFSMHKLSVPSFVHELLLCSKHQVT